MIVSQFRISIDPVNFVDSTYSFSNIRHQVFGFKLIKPHDYGMIGYNKF
jgi:hypothetical protein